MFLVGREGRIQGSGLLHRTSHDRFEFQDLPLLPAASSPSPGFQTRQRQTLGNFFLYFFPWESKGTPPMPSPQEKRPYQGVSNNKALIRTYFLGGWHWGRFPWIFVAGPQKVSQGWFFGVFNIHTVIPSYQKFQVPKMQVLNLTMLWMWWGMKHVSKF